MQPERRVAFLIFSKLIIEQELTVYEFRVLWVEGDNGTKYRAGV